jgi:hypothetical protein
LEEEVLDTTINGHDDDGDDDGADDGAENIDEPQGSNPINVDSKQSLVCHISCADVPKLEFCLASTEIILDLLKSLHGPVCKRSGCNRQLHFRKSFVGTCLVVNWCHACLATLVEGILTQDILFIILHVYHSISANNWAVHIIHKELSSFVGKQVVLIWLINLVNIET